VPACAYTHPARHRSLPSLARAASPTPAHLPQVSVAGILEQQDRSDTFRHRAIDLIRIDALAGGDAGALGLGGGVPASSAVLGGGAPAVARANGSAQRGDFGSSSGALTAHPGSGGIDLRQLTGSSNAAAATSLQPQQRPTLAQTQAQPRPDAGSKDAAAGADGPLLELRTASSFKERKSGGCRACGCLSSWGRTCTAARNCVCVRAARGRSAQ
jgi:hypothetical protein